MSDQQPCGLRLTAKAVHAVEHHFGGADGSAIQPQQHPWGQYARYALPAGAHHLDKLSVKLGCREDAGTAMASALE